jgi:hypothetical protein
MDHVEDILLQNIQKFGPGVLVVASMKVVVVRVVVPCSQVVVYQHFRHTYSLHHHPCDGSSKYLRSVTKLLPDYIASQSS